MLVLDNSFEVSLFCSLLPFYFFFLVLDGSRYLGNSWKHKFNLILFSIEPARRAVGHPAPQRHNIFVFKKKGEGRKEKMGSRWDGGKKRVCERESRISLHPPSSTAHIAHLCIFSFRSRRSPLPRFLSELRRAGRGTCRAFSARQQHRPLPKSCLLPHSQTRS